MALNYKDIYRRNNPRKNIKCNPLYLDNYKPLMENFSNLDTTDFGMHGGNYEDNYSYLDSPQEEDIKLYCENNKYILNNKGTKKKMDLDVKKLFNRKNKGEILDIDFIHNNKIIKSLDYDKTNILAVQKIGKRLVPNLNEKVILGNAYRNLEDPFFSHPAHNKYNWQNSYEVKNSEFKKSNDKNIDGKWWNWEKNNIKPLDPRSVIDYRNKRPLKVDYTLIDYKN
jgi:hypothetical protein